MKIIVQAVQSKSRESQDYSEFEEMKASLAAALEQSVTDDGPEDDAYLDFMRFVMRRQALAQPA